MGDSHKGAQSHDQRFARWVERTVRPRLPVLVVVTSAFLVSDWYANHWADIYFRAQLTLDGHGSPDLLMGTIGALIFTLGFATCALLRFIPRAPP